MQRSLIIFLLGLQSFSACSQDRKLTDFPSAEEVVKEFYGKYNTGQLEYPEVAFEKRKEGWYVVTQRVNKNRLDIVDKYIFYDRPTKKYKEIPLEKNQYNEDIDPSKYLSGFDSRNFKLQYYYGYKGWYKDVVEELKNKKDLSDDELNALGRAYSTWSLGLLSDQYGDAPENEIWQLRLDINCLSPSQIKQFNDLQEKAQYNFKKLADRNPGYETIVGTIGMKYSNEKMFQYTVLLAHANDYAAKMRLPDDLYTVETLDSARMILERCPPNSIFLSISDNDYYPFHYLQKVKGFRKDVYVINYSLLGLDRYIYRATFPVYDVKAVSIMADTSLYKRNNHEMVYVRDSSYSLMYSGLLQKMLFSPKDEFGRVTINARSISVTKTESNYLGTTIGTMAVIPLKDVKYLYKQQWILLDILENLKGRKICFLYGFVDELKGLNDHISYDGVLGMYDN